MKCASEVKHLFFPHDSHSGKGHALPPLLCVTLLSLCACLLILSGCATIAEKEKIKDLDKTVNSYGTALRFGYIELAKTYIRSDKKIKKDPAADLTGIKITSYEILGRELSPEKLEAKQVVEIQYYYTDSLIEKTMQDVQLWKYDLTEEKWYLHSGLPVFK